MSQPMRFADFEEDRDTPHPKCEFCWDEWVVSIEGQRDLCPECIVRVIHKNKPTDPQGVTPGITSYFLSNCHTAIDLSDLLRHTGFESIDDLVQAAGRGKENAL